MPSKKAFTGLITEHKNTHSPLSPSIKPINPTEPSFFNPMRRFATFLCLCLVVLPVVLPAHARDTGEAAQNTASEHSTNESSSSSVGVSINLATGAPSLTLGMSQGEGQGDGDDLGWSNTHVSAGNTVTMISGGDMNLIGAVASGNTVNLDVGSLYGGNLNLESLQNKSTYDSDQESSGFNASLGFDLSNFGGSVNAGQSNITSDYASVSETSGIQAGDGGFKVIVKGDTSLIGSVIASSEKAVEENKNSFETGGQLTLANLENHADFEASGASVTVGGSFSGKPEGEANPGGGFKPSGSAGVGEDEGHASSTTEAGISGIAGKEDVRTGDAETGLQNNFDKDKVQKEIDAQIAITQSFGQQASKAVGDYAQSQTDKASKLRLEAAQLNEADPRAAELIAQAKEIESQWGENGTLRLAAHTVIGGLTGGANGALGSLVGTMTASQAAQMLRESGITQESNPLLYNSLVALASTAAGALVGGEMGAGTALNEVANNFLKHDRPQYYAARLKECTSQSCKDQVLDEIMKESNQNVTELGTCWESGDSDCVKRIGSEIETNPLAYTGILSGYASDAGRYVYDSANRFADLIEKGNEHNWVVANLLHETSGLVEYADFLLLGGFGKGKPGASLPKQEVKPGAGVGVVEKETAGGKPGSGEANVAAKDVREIKLADGFYQAEGSAFKFSEYYYNRLWSTGRGAPFLQAEELLNTAKIITPDRMPGFNRYVNDFFEMVYNPTTKEVWHIQPLRK